MATKIGKAMLGNELPATLNGLIVRVSLWLALFLSYFPSVFFFFHAISPARVSRQGRAGVVLLVRVSKAPDRRRLPLSMCFYIHLGVGKEHVELSTGS